MNMMVLIIVLLIILVALGMAAALMMGNQNAQKKRTMAVIRGGSSSASVTDPKALRNKRRDEIAKKLKGAEKESGEKKKVTMSAQLEQAGLRISVAQYWIFSVVASVVLIMVGKLIGLSPFVLVMMGVIGLFGVPKFFLRWKTKRRQKQFLEEFPDALEAMVRLLKAGMPVTEAIAMSAKEFTGPVGEEMERIYDAQKVGVSLPEATLDAARRMPLTEMQMFATGISIQAQTGASLSEVLMNLSGVIRARFRLKRKVQALSSEAKASASIIGALPFLVGGGIYFINPAQMEVMFTTTIGKALLVGAAFWMLIGILIMKIMINFKV